MRTNETRLKTIVEQVILFMKIAANLWSIWMALFDYRPKKKTEFEIKMISQFFGFDWNFCSKLNLCTSWDFCRQNCWQWESPLESWYRTKNKIRTLDAASCCVSMPSKVEKVVNTFGNVHFESNLTWKPIFNPNFSFWIQVINGQIFSN